MKKLFIAFMSTVLCFAFVCPIRADAQIINQIIYIDSELSDSDKIFFNKYQQILQYFYYDNSDLKIQLTDNELIEDNGFSLNEVTRIHEILYKGSKSPVLPEGHSNIYVSGLKVYFTRDDVRGLLMSAAQIGPAAIAATLAGLASSIPLIGSIISAFGAAAISSGVCYKALQAVVNYQGLYIGIEMNGVFPNFVCDTY